MFRRLPVRNAPEVISTGIVDAGGVTGADRIAVDTTVIGMGGEAVSAEIVRAGRDTALSPSPSSVQPCVSSLAPLNRTE